MEENKPLLYSKYLKETLVEEDVVYNGELGQKAGLFLVSYKNITGDTLMEISYDMENPNNKTGLSMYYFPNGLVHKIKAYNRKGMYTGERCFHYNGHLHYDLVLKKEHRKDAAIGVYKKHPKWMVDVIVSEGKQFCFDDAGIKKDIQNPSLLLNQLIDYSIDNNSKEELTAMYLGVYDEEGRALLDENGNGAEVLYDSIKKHKIYRDYKDFKLLTSYYYNKDSIKVYQYCDRPLKINKKSGIDSGFEKVYFKHGSMQIPEGFVAFRCVVDEKGGILEYELLNAKSESNYNAFFSYWYGKLKASPYVWKVAKHNGERVRGEVIIPVLVLSEDYGGNVSDRFNNYWMHHHMMWNMNHMNHMNNFKPPTSF